LEDSPRDAKLTASALEGGGFKAQFEVTDSPDCFRESLKKAEYDVILADFNLRNWTALDALDILKRSGKDIPLIVVSGALGDEAAVECIKQGAADFVLKDRPAQLPAAIRRALEEKRLRTENQQALEDISRLASIVESSEDAIIGKTCEGVIQSWNCAAEKLYGYTAAEMIGKSASLLVPPEHQEEYKAIFGRIKQCEEVHHHETTRVTKGGRQIDMSVTTSPLKNGRGEVFGVSTIARDITEHKQAERYQQLTVEILGILNGPLAVPEVITEILAAIKRATGFYAIGIRLRSGDDFPYVAHEGFPPEFLLEENTLIGHDSKGAICRDENGKVFLKCSCGLVISGQTDPSDPLFTEGGSYWTNDSLALPSLPANPDPRLHSRNNCILQGYCSVALIPIRAEGDVVGLLQLNDRRKGCFTPQMIRFLEGISAAIGVALKRKQQQDALRASEIRYRRLFEAAHDGILILAADSGEIRDVNPFLTNLLGFSQAELLGLKLWDIGPLKDALWSKIDFKELQTKGFIRYENLPLETRDGRHIAVEFVSNVFLVGDEKVIQCNIRDITERKRAEAEHLRLVTAIEQSAEAVMITNTAGDIEYVNPAFSHITRYSREEVLGQNARILKSGHQDQELYHQLWATILQGKNWQGELINRRKDGSLYTEQMSIAPVRGEHGTLTHFIATKQDVTARKQLEQQFVQAQKMEAVGRLAGGVAHDFNNLLTIINGYAHLLMERSSPEDSRRGLFEEILIAGERAATLTRQLLAFSHRQVMEARVLDLNSVLADTEKMLRRLIREDVEMVVMLKPGLGLVKVDPGQIEQVIMNLAINASDAMPQGGKLLIETSSVEIEKDKARSRPNMAPGKYLMVAVSDTGCGMDLETQAHIFEPFFTTKEKGKGTGLGLATVYGIVEQSGGFIWVYSEPGQGSTFKIYFPCIEGSVPMAEPAKVRPPKRANGHEIVLVVEDEIGVRMLVCETLKSKGYKVLEADGALQALEMAKQHTKPIHLLLTDVVMPEVGGKELANRLSTLHPETKVLYMSGYTDDAIVRHGILTGSMAFLQKPFTPNALVQKIREVLKMKQETLQ
jgi:PAS domain S-box-containing protein